MRLTRLYIDMPLHEATEVALPAAAAQHAVKVLRLTAGDPVVLFNGDGHDYPGTLARTGRDGVRVSLHSPCAAVAESPLPLTLAQALARGDKMDLVMRKATELGVTRIVPLLTERSEVRLDARRIDRRMDHWKAVITSACEQCGRAHLPDLEPPQALPAWLQAQAGGDALRLALLPGSRRRVRDLQPDPGTDIMLVVGPEGGLGERDIAALTSAGFTGLDLGPRILRTETAGLAALAAMQALHGDG